MDFDTAFKHILKYEGGLVDHPADPGGITKFGISLRAYPELGTEGVRSLTKDDAKVIYKRDYWDACYCESLPDSLRLMVFDCAVNQGVGYATRALQAAVSVRADGTIGPVTLQAIKDTNPESALQKLAQNRYLRYKNNKNWDTFGDGWVNRLLSVCLSS